MWTLVEQCAVLVSLFNLWTIISFLSSVNDLHLYLDYKNIDLYCVSLFSFLCAISSVGLLKTCHRSPSLTLLNREAYNFGQTWSEFWVEL